MLSKIRCYIVPLPYPPDKDTTAVNHPDIIREMQPASKPGMVPPRSFLANPVLCRPGVRLQPLAVGQGGGNLP